jgi:hypothetical protein
LLNLDGQDLDTAAAGRRIAAMTEEEKNAVTEYVACVAAVLFCSPFFQCAPLRQPHGSGTGGAVATAQLGSVRPFPPRVLSVVFTLTLHQ